MVNIYANLYEKKLRTIENVPELWRQDTINELKRRGTWREEE